MAKKDELPKIERKYPDRQIKKMSLAEIEKAITVCEAEREALFAAREEESTDRSERWSREYVRQLTRTRGEDLSALRHARTDRRIADRKAREKSIKSKLRWKR